MVLLNLEGINFIVGAVSSVIVSLLETKITVNKVTPYTITIKDFSSYPINGSKTITKPQQSLSLNDNESATAYIYIKTTKNVTLKVVTTLNANFQGLVLLGIGKFSNSNQCKMFAEEYGINVTHNTSSTVYYLCPIEDNAFKICNSFPCTINITLNVTSYKKVFPFVKVYNAQEDGELIFRTVVYK